jgi:hypothetical protein
MSSMSAATHDKLFAVSFVFRLNIEGKLVEQPIAILVLYTLIFYTLPIQHVVLHVKI